MVYSLQNKNPIYINELLQNMFNKFIFLIVYKKFKQTTKQKSISEAVIVDSRLQIAVQI